MSNNKKQLLKYLKNSQNSMTHSFAMSSIQFRDALALRYGNGGEFTVCNALNCKKGGLVILRHN